MDKESCDWSEYLLAAVELPVMGWHRHGYHPPQGDCRPARVSLEWHAEARSSRPSRRPQKCPAQLCTQALSSLKHTWVSSPWMGLDVHTHYHSLQQDLATCTRHASHSFTRPPRKQTMSEDTWTLVRTKRRWRRNLAACQQLQRKTLLQAFLLTWRQTCFKTAVVDDSLSCRIEFDIILKKLDVDIATALHQFRSHGRQVTQALRHDDARFYASLAQESYQWLSHNTLVSSGKCFEEICRDSDNGESGMSL